MPLFRGLSAFPITPADTHGRVDTHAFAALITRLAEAPIGSIGVLGSTGTYAYLTRVARRRAVETAVEAAAGRVPVMVGIGALRTDEAVALGQDARAAGADAVLLAPMSYTPLTDDEVFTHFATVAHAVGLPLCIYNNPGTTHFTIGEALLARLSRVDHIVAAKNPAPATNLTALRGATPAGFLLGYAVDWLAAEALRAGADAWYSVAAGLFPELCAEIAAGAPSARMQPLWDAFQAYGSLRVVYAAARLLQLTDAAPPLPILPLEGAALEQVRQALLF
jgi:4-hydroxy-tetrahydrodipicolinate synthase